MKDFERIDQLVKDMSRLEKSFYKEINLQFKESSEYFDENNKIMGAMKQCIAISLQHILERLIQLPITHYGTKCVIKECDRPQVYGSDSCQEHVSIERAKELTFHD